MQFWLFRVSINVADPGSLFAGTPPTHAERFAVLREALMHSQPAIYRGVTYELYNVEEVDGTIIGRVSHPDEVERTIPAETPGQLVDLREDSNAWAHFVFYGLGEQILAVQRKGEFFAGEAEGMASILQRLISASLPPQTYDVSVYPLLRKGDFWSTLERLSGVRRIEFEFVAPNMFGGREHLAQLLDVQRELHNANLFRAGVESTSAALRFPRNEQTEAEVIYAEKGGGAWRVEGVGRTGEAIAVKSDGESAVLTEITDDDTLRVSIRHRVEDLIHKIAQCLKNL